MSAFISAVAIHEAGHAVAAIVATKELEVFQKRLSEALNSPRQECASISAIDIRFARARADLQQLCDGAGADLDLVRARQRKWGGRPVACRATQSLSSANCCERGRCASDLWRRPFA
jgi:hypothetical protein